MAKRPDLVDITSITNSSTITAINQNWDRIQEAFDNTVSLDGSTPNAMNGDLDINGNAILNVGTIDTENLTLNGQQVTDLASVPEWRSAWVTATIYTKNDLVKINGNVYICLESHTSGTFATDLTMLKWELMVPKGDSGAGTGDLLSANNLSDLANPATARANLGLGAVATENTVPIAKGGTGATDAATARGNLGAQAAGDTLNSLGGLSLVQGDVLYASGPDTLTRLPKGSARQSFVMNAGATAPEWRNAVIHASQAASGSSVTFTGLPAGVDEITLGCDFISGSAGMSVLVRLGTAGGIVVSGYAGVQASIAHGLTPGVTLHNTQMVPGGTIGAAGSYLGSVTIRRVYDGGNIWMLTSTGFRSDDNALQTAFSRVDISGELTQIQILASTGTFDSGFFTLMYGLS